MAGKTPRPQAIQERILTPLLTRCPECGRRMWWDYTNDHKVATLEGMVRLWLQIRRCPNPDCSHYHRPYRPEEEGRIVLPHYEYGLDVLALLGALRYQGHGSVPEIHRALVERGVSIGQRAEELGGIGEVRYPELISLEARYRFFFNPIHYTSLGLAVCEAMMLGMPVVALATTEMVTVIDNNVNGYADTNMARLIDVMQSLLHDPALARHLGEGTRRYTGERFNIHRFVDEWNRAFDYVCGF